MNTTEMIKISVIMPSLNVASYIVETIQSVRNQGIKEIEILCIDAGSTDGTWELIQEAAQKDNRIIAIQSDRKSYGLQVNMGLDMARGKYVAILETDDYVSYDMYQKLYDFAEMNNVDFVKCDYKAYFTNSEGERKFIDRYVGANKLLYSEVFSPKDQLNTIIDDWYLWNGIYKTEFLRKNDIKLSETPGAAFQDIGFLHKVARCAERVIYLNEPLYYYCIDREGASSNSGKTLDYIYSEYGRLMNEIGEDSESVENNMLYRRMARSFVRACMETEDSALESDKSVEIFRWFRDKLENAEQNGWIQVMDIPYGLRKGYIGIMRPTLGFIAYRRSEREKINEFLRGDEPIIIFGCGIYGKEALKFVLDSGKKVEAFMDNDKALWGATINGYSVLSPTEIINMPKTTRYLIANEKHSEDIKKQLLGYFDAIKVYIYE